MVYILPNPAFARTASRIVCLEQIAMGLLSLWFTRQATSPVHPETIDSFGDFEDARTPAPPQPRRQKRAAGTSRPPLEHPGVTN
jgi:hypothetical protein